MEQLSRPGAPADIRYTGPVVSLPLRDHRDVPAKRQRPQVLHIGSSVSLVNARSGTVGFFARCRRDKKVIGIVSANHVIGGQDRAQINDPILSPGGMRYGERVASFVRAVQLRGGEENYVDCAFARLVDTKNFDPSTLPNGKTLKGDLAMVRKDQKVFTYSDEFDERCGVVSLPDQDAFKMHYRAGIGLVLFDDQIEVESDSGGHFSRPGDSGALVYDEKGRPVGLLFAQTIAGGRNGGGLSYVNPIARVLDLLEIDIITELPA